MSILEILKKYNPERIRVREFIQPQKIEKILQIVLN
jgi:hypothetical protein